MRAPSPSTNWEDRICPHGHHVLKTKHTEVGQKKNGVEWLSSSLVFGQKKFAHRTDGIWSGRWCRRRRRWHRQEKVKKGEVLINISNWTCDTHTVRRYTDAHTLAHAHAHNTRTQNHERTWIRNAQPRYEKKFTTIPINVTKESNELSTWLLLLFYLANEVWRWLPHRTTNANEMNCCSARQQIVTRIRLYGGDHGSDNTRFIRAILLRFPMCLWFIYIWYVLLIARTVARPLSKSNKKAKCYIFPLDAPYTRIRGIRSRRVASSVRTCTAAMVVLGLFSAIWQRQPRWLWQRRQPQSIGIHSAWAFVEKTFATMKPVYLIAYSMCLLNVRGIDWGGAGERARAVHTQQMKETIQYICTEHTNAPYTRPTILSSWFVIRLTFFRRIFVFFFYRFFFRVKNFLFLSLCLADCVLEWTTQTHKHTCSLLCQLWSKWRWCYLHSVTARFISSFLPSLSIKLKNERSHLWAMRREQ